MGPPLTSSGKIEPIALIGRSTSMAGGGAPPSISTPRGSGPSRTTFTFATVSSRWSRPRPCRSASASATLAPIDATSRQGRARMRESSAASGTPGGVASSANGRPSGRIPSTRGTCRFAPLASRPWFERARNSLAARESRAAGVASTRTSTSEPSPAARACHVSIDAPDRRSRASRNGARAPAGAASVTCGTRGAAPRALRP